MKKYLYFITVASVKIFYCTTLIISFAECIQAQEMVTRRYTVKDGLPSNYVYGASQDKFGYLWVGTPEGFSRFDGKNFINYGLADGLPDARAGGALMDSQLRLWVATPRGVAQFKGNKFINYPLSDSQTIHWVSQIFETNENQIWCLTNKGVYQFDIDKWKKIKLYPGFENSGCINVVESDDGLYINYGNLVALKKTDNTFKIIGDQKPVNFYYGIFYKSAGQIFVSTLDGEHEIINQQLIKLPGVLGQLKGIYTCFPDSKKRFWVGRYKIGLQLLGTEDTLHFKQVIKPSNDFLPQGFSEDKQGNIWVGTGTGLIRVSEMEFKNFDLPGIIGKNVLRNVLQPPGGPVLLNDGSLVFKTLENDVPGEKKIQLRGATPLPNNELIIDHYAFDDKGRCWYYIRGFALAMQDGNNVFAQSSKLAHLGDQAFDVLFDNYRKKILVAVRTQKYPCQFNDTSYSLLKVTNNVDVPGNIMHLHQCVNGTILFSTDRGLIYSIDKNNVCKLQLNEFNGQGYISSFHNDTDGDVWIIYSGRGVRHYTWQKDVLVFKEQITKANGLTSDNTASLCFDNNNNLWVCNNSTVTIFSKKNNNSNYRVVSFFNAEDLQTDGSIEARMIKDNKGNIWYFSARYLVCFYPDKVNYTPPTPTIKIENIELNLRQTNWMDYADSLSGIFQLPYNLKLTHDNNTIGIYFKGISSSGTDDIKYAYQLEGLEDLWSTASSNNFVSFVRLPPGKYTFKVKTQLPNTNWSEPAVFSFEIKKAFWQTWWFFILTGIIIITAVYFLFRYRLKQKTNLLEMRNQFS